MSKAEEKARAKKRAAERAGKPKANKGAKSDAKVRPGIFDAKSDAMRRIGGAAHIKSAGGARRGAARSR